MLHGLFRNFESIPDRRLSPNISNSNAGIPLQASTAFLNLYKPTFTVTNSQGHRKHMHKQKSYQKKTYQRLFLLEFCLLSSCFIPDCCVRAINCNLLSYRFETQAKNQTNFLSTDQPRPA